MVTLRRSGERVPGADLPTILGALRRAGLPTDRIDDATLVVDADVSHGGMIWPLPVVVEAPDRRFLRVRTWPFADRQPGPGSDYAALLTLADQLFAVRIGLDGGRALVLSVDLPAARVDGAAVLDAIALLAQAVGEIHPLLDHALVWNEGGRDIGAGGDADGSATEGNALASQPGHASM